MTTDASPQGARDETWRVFIAAEIPPDIRTALDDVRRRLAPRHERAIRWLPLDGIHLTLRFLGDIQAGLVPAITQRIDHAASQTGRFQLELAGTGCFPAIERPRVFWVGLKGDLQRLTQLHGRLEGGLAAIGIEADTRPFHPHLTVGRDATNARPFEVQDAGYAFTRLTVASGLKLNVATIRLFRSHLTKDGARYESLHSADLG